MDKEYEIHNLKKKLGDINTKIREELNKISQLKIKISTAYRRRDKMKYEADRKQIMLNLKQYEDNMGIIKKRLSELEAVPL